MADDHHYQPRQYQPLSTTAPTTAPQGTQAAPQLPPPSAHLYPMSHPTAPTPSDVAGVFFQSSLHSVPSRLHFIPSHLHSAHLHSSHPHSSHPHSSQPRLYAAHHAGSLPLAHLQIPIPTISLDAIDADLLAYSAPVPPPSVTASTSGTDIFAVQGSSGDGSSGMAYSSSGDSNVNPPMSNAPTSNSPSNPPKRAAQVNKAAAAPTATAPPGVALTTTLPPYTNLPTPLPNPPLPGRPLLSSSETHSLIKAAAATDVALTQPPLSPGPKKRMKPSMLPAGERAQLARDRNRIHAQSTRLRKKAYTQRLCDLVDSMSAAVENSRRETKIWEERRLECGKVRREVLREVLKMHCTGIVGTGSWIRVVDEEFKMRCPVTSFRSYDKMEVESTKNMRELKGLRAMARDSASQFVFFQSIGREQLKWKVLKLEIFFKDHNELLLTLRDKRHVAAAAKPKAVSNSEGNSTEESSESRSNSDNNSTSSDDEKESKDSKDGGSKDSAQSSTKAPGSEDAAAATASPLLHNYDLETIDDEPLHKQNKKQRKMYEDADRAADDKNRTTGMHHHLDSVAPKTHVGPFLGLGKKEKKAVAPPPKQVGDEAGSSSDDKNNITGSTTTGTMTTNHSSSLDSSSDNNTNTNWMEGGSCIRAEYDLGTDEDSGILNNTESDCLMARYMLRTTNLVKMGGARELCVDGMLQAKYSEVNRLKSLEITYDVKSLIEQIGNFEEAPLTANDAMKKGMRSRLLVKCEAPYKVSFANEMWRNMVGYSTEQLEGLGLVELLELGYARSEGKGWGELERVSSERVKKMLEEIAGSGRACSNCVLGVRADGSKVINFMKALPLINSDCEPSYFLIEGQDLCEDSVVRANHGLWKKKEGLAEGAGLKRKSEGGET